MIDASVKELAARGMASWLDPLRAIDGLELLAVHADEEMSKLLLLFTNDALLVEADPNDDTVVIGRLGDADSQDGLGVDLSTSAEWEPMIGKPLGWSWAMLNQKGYVDGVLFSSGDVIPDIVVTVVASSLKVRRVSESVC